MEVSSLQLSSVVDFINAGAKSRASFAFGLEVEHLVVAKGTQEAVPYLGASGIAAVLERIAQQEAIQFEGVYQGEHLLGLVASKMEVSLEPGAQLECSVGPFAKPEQSLAHYAKFRAVLDAVLGEFDYEVLTIGYQPVSRKDDISIIPKPRYAAMNEYLGKSGRYGLNMMRASASTQVSIDFFSEQDAVQKLRLSSLLGPLLCYKFANTPYFEGEPNRYRLLRVQMWDDLDPLRASTIPHLFEEDFGFERYAHYALSTPLMVVDYSQTPEFNGEFSGSSSKDGQVQVTHKTAAELYPDRRLNDFEIAHILSTYFFDVRLKNFVELRTCDSLPEDKVLEYMKLVERVFYDTGNFDYLCSQLQDFDAKSIVEAKREIEDKGDEAVCYGRDIKEWLNVL